MNDQRWDVIQADVFEWLADYDGPKFHAVLGDPPYGINFMGKDWDNFRCAKNSADIGRENVFGRLSRTSPASGSESNNRYYQEWVTGWASLLIEKALYPGAVCLFFGGTRTWHRLACGLEDAGFEVVDCFMWLYGQGFPKGMNISKAIDKAMGVEREVVGMRKHPTLKDVSKVDRQSATQYHAANPIADEWPVTVPATEMAEQWNGWNTALKPAWEPIILCRAPRGEHRFVDLALEYGTGALWVDGCRIEGPTWTRDTPHRDDIRGGNYGRSEGRYIEWNPQKSHPHGRWPANLLLSHLQGCKKVGEKKIELPAPIKPHLIPDDYLYGSNRTSGVGVVVTADGKTETVEIWKCVRGCPVAALDEQSGISRSSGGGGYRRNGAAPNEIYGRFGELTYPQNVGKGNIGAASRFFYVSKSSSSERNAGLPDGMKNMHPTMKPLAITEYLARLLLPPVLDEPRNILVPFAGSGSEMIGAWRAGWDNVTGVEINPDYMAIAQHRLNYHTLQAKLL